MRRSPAVLALIGVLGTSPADARSVTVGEECRTLQECVDSAADGTTIVIPPGEYAEGVRIDDKSLKLVGKPSKEQAVTLLPPRDAYAVHVQRGKVTIRNLVTRGGFGLGVVDGEMVVRGTSINESLEHGVASKQSKVTITKSQISGQQYYGVQTLGSMLKVKDLTIDNPSGDGAGVYINNQESAGFIFPVDAGANSVLDGLSVHNHPGGGLFIIGDWFDYHVKNSFFHTNGRFNVYLLGVDKTVVEKSQMTDSYPNSADITDNPADGVMVYSSHDVLLDDLKVIGNDRAGIIFDESDGTVSNDVSINNLYGLVLQGLVRPAYKDLGNVFTPNSKLDILLDGDLPVPSTLSPIPEHP
jgi:hypothetical protein